MNTENQMNELDQMLIQQSNIAYPLCLIKLFQGDHISAMILNKALYWAKKTNNNFYKFYEPCNHPLYKKGDSWSEELLISRRKMRYHLNMLKEYIIICKASNNLIFYSVNIPFLLKKLNKFHEHTEQNVKPEETKCQIISDKMSQHTEQNVKPEETKCQIISDKMSQHTEQNVKPEVTKCQIIGDKMSHHTEQNVKSYVTKCQIIGDKMSHHTEQNVKSLLSINHQSDLFSRSEDEIKKMNVLKSVNILGNDGETICKKFSLDFIQKKIDLVKSKFDKGEIRSLRTYAMTMFRNEPSELTPYEEDQIRKKKEKETERLKKLELDKQKKAEEQEKQKAFLLSTDELMKSATESDLAEFLEELKAQSFIIFQKYLLHGLSNLLVESRYRHFLFQKYKQ